MKKICYSDNGKGELQVRAQYEFYSITNALIRFIYTGLLHSKYLYILTFGWGHIFMNI